MKYGIEIQQRLNNGILGGPLQCDFTITIDSILYEISIEQLGIRKTTITTDSTVDLDEMIKLFNELDMLIMLGEGQFIPIVESKIINDDIVSNSDAIDLIFEKRLKMFNSADFTIGSHSTFLSFDKYVDANLFMKWVSMLKELDILHNMVLYSMADTGMTIDCKSAFLIEAFEALSELIEMYDSSFQRPKVNKGESKLKKYICAVIQKYGVDIFSKEMSDDLEKVIQILVNSRNRIAHIKSKQDKLYLNGSESVLYAVKMAFLYRNILLVLLGVDYRLYSNAIVNSINGWNEWNHTLDTFLDRIK